MVDIATVMGVCIFPSNTDTISVTIPSDSKAVYSSISNPMVTAVKKSKHEEVKKWVNIIHFIYKRSSMIQLTSLHSLNYFNIDLLLQNQFMKLALSGIVSEAVSNVLTVTSSSAVA